jgi:hypothetical protein
MLPDGTMGHYSNMDDDDWVDPPMPASRSSLRGSKRTAKQLLAERDRQIADAQRNFQYALSACKSHADARPTTEHRHTSAVDQAGPVPDETSWPSWCLASEQTPLDVPAQLSQANLNQVDGGVRSLSPPPPSMDRKGVERPHVGKGRRPFWTTVITSFSTKT